MHANSRTVIDSVLAELHAAYKPVTEGHLADYIPELAKADPDQFGIAIVTADGGVYTVGDCDTTFTIQSISKPFVFGLALEDYGRDHVLSKVGVEPSGDAFNSIMFDERANRPFNPMVNAGAIATSALVKGVGGHHRLGRILSMFERFIGHPVAVDPSVFQSEKATGHRNRAIAHLELNFGMIDDRVDEHLDLYFQQCSALVTCRDLATMAATLANGGVNPLTGIRAIQTDYVKNVIAVMNSCGMYDYSGEWSYRIGLPAKSGVGGGIIAMLPGRMGIGVFSPPLDTRGNSVRGIKVCEALSLRFGLNMFDVAMNPTPAVRRHFDGTAVGSKRSRSAAERGILDTKGNRIQVLELRGDLTFIAVEQITRRLSALPDTASHIILDLARVVQVDPPAARLIIALIDQFAATRRQIRLANLAPGSTSRQQMAAAGLDETGIFTGLDEALEWAEEQILAEGPTGQATAECGLTEMDLISGLMPEQLTVLEPALERMTYAAGAVLFKEGDPATHLFFLAKGMVSVHVGTGPGRSKRLTTLSAGMAFGEMALLDGDRRSANVRAETDVIVYGLELERLGLLARQHPAIQSTILLNLGRLLSQRLRKSNNEIRSLE